MQKKKLNTIIFCFWICFILINHPYKCMFLIGSDNPIGIYPKALASSNTQGHISPKGKTDKKYWYCLRFLYLPITCHIYLFVPRWTQEHATVTDYIYGGKKPDRERGNLWPFESFCHTFTPTYHQRGSQH